MSVKQLAPALGLIFACSAGAQTRVVSGVFISTLGADTIQVERYTRTGYKLEGDILRRSPTVQMVHYVADISNGRFKGMSVTTRRYAADPMTPPVFSMVALLADTSANLEVMRNGRPDTSSTGNRLFKGRAAPFIAGTPPSVALYEQLLAFNALTVRDSVPITLIGVGYPPDTRLTLLRRTRDTVAFVTSFFPGWIEVAAVDSRGRIQAVDASATTVKAVTRRVAAIDFEALAKRWTAYETAHGPAGPMSPPDTLRARVGSADIEIAYSRPFKRGRTIFGSPVVPWNAVWRTGANAATQFTTSAELIFGNTIVPAGKYTLWTLPIREGAKLIINTQTGQWGTDYDATRDLARVDLQQTILSKPVEEFTFAIVPQGTGAILKYSWDDREYSIPIRVK